MSESPCAVAAGDGVRACGGTRPSPVCMSAERRVPTLVVNNRIHEEEPMRGARSAKWVAGAIVVALAATACGGGSDDKGDSSKKGALAGYVSIDVGEPQKPLVPADTNESNGAYVIRALFTQLLDFDEKGEIVYTNAESVTTEDSKTWTIKLKE